MLTPLQQRLLDLLGRLPEAAGFALAGGAALIMRGTVERNTNDLDFFIGHADVEADTIATMVAAVERALGEAAPSSSRSTATNALCMSASRRFITPKYLIAPFDQPRYRRKSYSEYRS